MNAENNNHSVFVLNYKLILTVNNLENLITDIISNRLKELFDGIAENYNITSILWVNGVNYIDVTFKAHPNSELSKFINAYKTAGSKLVKREFSFDEDRLQQGQFWSKTFYLQTIGGNDDENIREFISKQNPFSRRKRKG